MPESSPVTTRLTLDEKLAVGTGASFWTTHASPAAEIRALTLTDGPHGLRGQGDDGDHLGLAASRTATCFPTASALASSWDVDLLAEVGDAIGREAADQNVDIVLGPGVNMKRNPLCGRNFEYFSEDPLLSGVLASAWIRGVQATGTGTSLKHFALNNQELKRMTTDVRVDERALREYYLPAFETAVKDAQPTTVMSAYNRVEGTYCSEHPRLLTDILRDEWGFRGAVVTDWGAMNDRAAAYAAGLDLEMPGNGGASDAEVRAALAAGSLDEESIDASVQRLQTLSERVSSQRGAPAADLYDRHDALAARVATESAVLLKNDGDLLPLAPSGSIAVVGALAEATRFQGTGSSRVNPTRVVSVREGLQNHHAIEYEPGYDLADRCDEALLRRAVDLAQRADRVIVCVGLTDDFESEGFDRSHMRIPENQLALLDALAPMSDRIAIVLVGGSAVEMPWERGAAAILHMQLSGQAVGRAAADVLFGQTNPSGKLAETYPLEYDDVVSAGRFGVEDYQTPYLESMLCGYRYFDSARMAVRFPFGHGLSYTTFEYTDLELVQVGTHDVDVHVTVRNTGTRRGAEVVQLYVAPRTGGAYRPAHELKAFAKVMLDAGEARTLTLPLHSRSFAVYSPARSEWIVEAGAYEIRIGASSRDVRLRESVELRGEEPSASDASRWHFSPRGKPTLDDFLTIHAPFPTNEPPQRGSYDMNSSLQEMKNASWACRMAYAGIERTIAKQFGGRVDYDDATFKMLMYSAVGLPMRAMARMSGGAMPLSMAQFLVESANGRTVRGAWRMLRARA